MRLRLIQDGLFFIGLAAFMTACWSEPDFSETPDINFVAVTKETIQASPGVGNGRRDSVVITIGFRDRSGDLGEDIGSIDSSRIRVVFGTQSWGNYKIQTLRLINGTYQEFRQEALEKVYFMRLFKPNQKGALEGTLDFRQKFFYNNRFQLYPVKFRVQIRDRALNASNVIETDTIVVPFPRL
jgi:hypothetical protein